MAFLNIAPENILNVMIDEFRRCSYPRDDHSTLSINICVSNKDKTSNIVVLISSSCSMGKLGSLLKRRGKGHTNRKS